MQAIRMTAAYETEIEAPADAVWELISDFAGVLRYWPQDDGTPVRIERMWLEGEHGKVPRARHVAVPGGSAIEVLFKEDARTRRHYYDMNDDGIPNVLNYMATVVVDETAPARCRIAYSSSYDIPADCDPVFYRDRVQAVYISLARGIKQYFAIPEEQRPGPTV